MDPNQWEQQREARRQARQERREQRRAACGGPDAFGGMMFGLIVVAVGVLFLLNNLNIINIGDFWDFWPVILIGLGLSKLVMPRSVSQVTFGIVLTAIGTLFLLRNLDIIFVNVWQFIWPILIIGWGLSMLASHLDWWDRPAVGLDGAPLAGSTADRVKIEVIFSGDKRRIVSQEFAGGKIEAVFGGVELDLRSAATKLPEIVIHADAVFGGVDLQIPETWVADVRGSGVFGGYLDKTHRTQSLDPNAPRLIVKGGAVFGGVTVRN